MVAVMAGEDIEPEKCVICLKKCLSSEKVVVSLKGLNTVLHYCKLRERPDLESYVAKCMEKNEEVLVHKDCRRNFTDMKRKVTYRADEASSFDTPNKRLRSSMEPFLWKEHCFLCGQAAKKDEKHPHRGIVYQVTHIGFRQRVLHKCDQRNDNWSHEVYTRIATNHDLVAVNAIYHKECFSRFVSNWPSADSPPNRRGRPKDESMQKWFQVLCVWLEGKSDGELYTLKELHDKMRELANGDKVYGEKRLKQKLEDRYKDSLVFAEVKGHSNIAFFRNTLDSIINNKWYESRREDTGEEAQRIIKTAAKLIMAEIREHEYNTVFYPSQNDILLQRMVPAGLKLLLEVLVKDELKQQSIGQAITYAARPRSFIPPILFGLAVEADHVFGSRWLIDELNQLGFSVSYSEVTRFKQSAVIEEDASTILQSIPCGTFTQFVGDNVDHNICTLDGKRTFHGMGILAASTNKDGIRAQTPPIKRHPLTRSTAITQNKGVKIVPYLSSDESAFSKIVLKSLRKLETPEIVNFGHNIDLLWQTAQMFPTESRPNWSGFMQTYSNGEHPGKSVITLLPIINLKPSDETCLYSTLLFVTELCNHYGMGTPCITFDQPLWIKAVEIITDKSLRIVCRLGGFHTLMSFLGSIGTLMKGSGLNECLQTIYGENAVTHIESGKAISRALRGHFLVQSALYGLLLDEFFCDEREEKQDDTENTGDQRDVKAFSKDEKEEIKILYKKLQKDAPNEKELEESSALTKVRSLLSEKMERLVDASRTAKLWIQYMEYVNVIKMFIAGERTGNWQLHLDAIFKMLNLFAATGHTNYAKSARLYLQTMRDLPSNYPDIHKKFTDEQCHTVRKSDRFWAGLWTDLVIEQSMMRALKSRGGLTMGRGMTDSVITTWIHSMHACASIHNAMTDLTNNHHKTSQQHVDLGASRLKRDMTDLGKLKDWLTKSSPFNEEEPFLKSISTGLTATKEDQINCDDAEQVGKAIQRQLDEMLFSKAKIKRKYQIRTLEYLKTGVQFDKDIRHVDPNLLFSRLVVLVERDDDMKECFKYELTPVPTSLFEHGIMRKPNKSALGRAIKQDVSAVTPPVPSFYVLDGGTLLHKVKWPCKSTYEIIIQHYVQFVNATYGRSCVVFDGYDNGPSTKDHEHKRRVGNISGNVTVALHNKPTCNQESFLKNSKNKSQFISLLVKALKDEGHDVRQSTGDADTQIVLAGLEYASKENKRPLTVVANDTDILVLLMFHWAAHMNLYMLSDVGKKQSQCWDIGSLVTSAGDMVTRHILFIHAWSGCDTTSATYGQGKQCY